MKLRELDIDIQDGHRKSRQFYEAITPVQEIYERYLKTIDLKQKVAKVCLYCASGSEGRQASALHEGVLVVAVPSDFAFLSLKDPAQRHVAALELIHQGMIKAASFVKSNTKTLENAYKMTLQQLSDQ